VGVQVSRELPKLTVKGSLSTSGTGESLVKGALMPLAAAVALSVKPTGHIGTVVVGADISTDGDGLATVDLEGPPRRIVGGRWKDHRQWSRRHGSTDRRRGGAQSGRSGAGGPHGQNMAME